MKRLLASVIAIQLLLLSGSSLFGAEQRIVRVGAFNYYPGIFKDSDGVVKGFYVDALADIAQRENIRFEYVYGSWNEGLERIKTGEVDLLTSVAYTPERAHYLDYAGTPLLTVWGELYTPLSSNIDGIREVQGKKIAVMKGDFNARAFMELTKKFDINCIFVEMAGFEDVFKAVASKKVDGGIVNSTFGVAKQKKYGLRSTGVVFNPFDIFFAVAKGKNQSLLALLDRYQMNWRHEVDSPYNKARRKWSHGSIGIAQIIPLWLVNSVAALGAMVLVAIVFIALLKKQVRVITEGVRQREARLLESEFNYRTLADSGPALIWTAGPDKLCNYFNKTWLCFTGRTFEQETGNGWAEGVHPDDFQQCLDMYCSAFDTREPFSMDYRLRRYDGEYRWIQDDACPRYSISGEFIGYIGYCFDITARKLAERDLQDKNSELEHFTYTVSHDLKSPLITIQSYVGMIKKDMESGNNARAQSDLMRIHGAALKMSAMLNALLELSRVGRVMNEPTHVDMKCLAIDCLAQLAGPLEQKGVEVSLQPDFPVVLGDPQRLSAVLQNLVENAIKYMGDQSAPRIEIGTREEVNETAFFVCDNGAGVDPCHQEHIFGLFNKLDAKSEGTGIGLALVRRVIEVHGGRVWVESEGTGKGCRFCFTLPKC